MITEQEQQTLILGVLAVLDLIEESRGVEGLHLNGDVAPWDELRTGGRFNEWLYKFDEAAEIAKREADNVAAFTARDSVAEDIEGAEPAGWVATIVGALCVLTGLLAWVAVLFGTR